MEYTDIDVKDQNHRRFPMKFSLLIGLAFAQSYSSYIIKLKESAISNLTKRGSDTLDLDWANRILQKNKVDSFDVSQDNDKIFYEYNFGSFQGFAVKTHEFSILEIDQDQRVEYVRKDGRLKLFTTWGIDRIDQRTKVLDDMYFSKTQGEGVTVYVIDTGVNDKHVEFEGRVSQGPGFANGVSTVGSPDTNGHGTHCSGTIASKTFGVAKKARVVVLKVFDESGGGDSGVIMALQWVYKNAVPGKSVVSMSIGTDLSNCVPIATKPTQEECNNKAMKAASAAIAVDKNIPVVAAAGNDNTDACKVAPASEPMVFTVGSTTKYDQRSSFSNFGSCVDIFAPGSSITSTWIRGTTATNTISGTSMACPHVAGAFALLLSEMSFPNVQAAYDEMTARSTKGAIKDPKNSVNNFLYVGTMNSTNLLKKRWSR